MHPDSAADHDRGRRPLCHTVMRMSGEQILGMWSDVPLRARVLASATQRYIFVETRHYSRHVSKTRRCGACANNLLFFFAILCPQYRGAAITCNYTVNAEGDPTAISWSGKC